MPRLAISILGPAQFQVDSQPLPRQVFEKARLLLAYLADNADRPYRRESLAALLWPDTPPPDARTNLRKALQVIRHALRPVDDCPGILVSDRDTVRLVSREGLWLDSRSFSEVSPACDYYPGSPACPVCLDRMESTAHLYRGPFLASFEPESESLSDWAGSRRESCHQHAFGLFSRLADCWARMGAPTRAIGWAEKCTLHEPWEEVGHRQLMHLLSSHGQAAAALAHFRSLSQRLDRELGTEPEAETYALFTQIRSQTQAPLPVTTDAPSVARREQRLLVALACELLPCRSLNPEAQADVLHAFTIRLKSAVRRAGGFTSMFEGRRITAYFGLPTAREDATREAVSTALAIQESASGSIECRMAIHTGLTIVDDTAGTPDPLGLVSGLALDLAHTVAPGTIAVSKAVKCLVEDFFHLEPLGAMSHQADRSLATWRVIAKTGVSDRIDAQRHRFPMVGRQRELEQLHSAWSDLKQQKQGRVIAIRGSPGVGKSRLLRAFSENLTAPVYEGRCFLNTQGTTMAPIVELLRSLFSLPSGLSETEQRRMLHEGAKGLGMEKEAPLLEQLLGIPVDIGEPGPDPGQLRYRIQGLLPRLLGEFGRLGPTVVILEDLHWADPSSLDVLSGVMAEIEALPSILLLISYRPEFTPPWRSTTVIEPDSLPVEAIHRMVEHLSGTSLDEWQMDQIAVMSGGVPLFVEELTRAQLDKVDAEGHSVPSTLAELMQARLEQLGPGRRLAQIGAAIGREFSADLLAATADVDPVGLGSRFAPLLRSGLWQINRTDGTSTIQFRHALLQEAAYETLLRSDRRAIHRKIARVIRESFPNICERHPEQLARHLTEAGETDIAVLQWQHAGDGSAPPEALGHFRAALDLLGTLPETHDRLARELSLQTRYGHALIHTRGYGSADAGQAFDRAWEIARDIGPSQQYEALFGLWQVSSSRKGFASSVEIGERLKHLIDGGEPLKAVQAHLSAGNPLVCLGRFTDAQRELERGIGIYRGLPFPPPLNPALNEDPGPPSLAFLAWSLWFQGFPDQAREHAEQAIALAERRDHPGTLCFVLSLAGHLFWMLREPERVRELSEQGIASAEANGLGFLRGTAALHLGWYQAMAGIPEGPALLKSCVEVASMGMPSMETTFQGPAMEAYALLGDTESLVVALERSRAASQRWGDRFWQPEIHRWAGCLLSRTDRETARVEFGRAIAVAREQGALLPELRATRDRLRLGSADNVASDRAALKHVLERFTEGFESLDLRESFTLLDE